MKRYVLGLALLFGLQAQLFSVFTADDEIMVSFKKIDDASLYNAVALLHVANHSDYDLVVSQAGISPSIGQASKLELICYEQRSAHIQNIVSLPAILFYAFFYYWTCTCIDNTMFEIPVKSIIGLQVAGALYYKLKYLQWIFKQYDVDAILQDIEVVSSHTTRHFLVVVNPDIDLEACQMHVNQVKDGRYMRYYLKID